MITRREIDIDKPKFSFLKALFPVLLAIVLLGATAFILFHFLSRTKIETLLQDKKKFSILVTVWDKEDKASPVKYFGILTVYPQTKRIGVVSLFPETRLSPDSPPLEKLLQEESPSQLRKTMSSILSLSIPYHASIDVKSLTRLVDLSEGLPFFIHSQDLLSEETLPHGELILDGSLVKPFLFLKNKKQESNSAIQLFRHYSFGLNFWDVRREKWDLLSSHSIFRLLLKDVDTNLSFIESYSLVKAISLDENWLPMFMEVPIKRIDDDFIADQETFALFWKNFQTKLTSAENPYDQPPKMEIKNGTNVTNLARKMRNNIYRKGIQVLEFTNADHHDYQHSILLDTNAHPYYLQNAGRLLGVTKTYHAVNRSLFTDLILIAGKDYSQLQLD